jgi:hypothetical protein
VEYKKTAGRRFFNIPCLDPDIDRPVRSIFFQSKDRTWCKSAGRRLGSIQFYLRNPGLFRTAYRLVGLSLAVVALLLAIELHLSFYFRIRLKIK